MRGDMVIGYGMNVENVKDKNVLKFLKNNIHSVEPNLQVIDWDAVEKAVAERGLNGCESEDEDIREAMSGIFAVSSYDYLNEVLFEVIAYIMMKQTGIHFEYMGMSDSDVIMLANVQPWMFNARERSLTEDELDGILVKYAEELGLPKTVVGDIYIESVY